MSPATTARVPGRSFLRRLAAHAGLAFVTLDPARAADPDFREVNPLAARLLGEAVCRELRVLPIALDGGVVTLATPAPFAEAALADARARLGRPVRVVVTPEEDLERALGAVPAAPREEGAPPLLGELLVSRGLVAARQVRGALAEQERAGGRLGELLVHRGELEPAALAGALAEQLRLPVIDLAGVEPDPTALALVPDALARRHRVVALGRDPTTLYVAVAEPLDDDTAAVLREHAGLELRTFLAPPAAVEELLGRVHGRRWAAQARDELRVRFPEESASRVLTTSQRRALGVLAVALVVGLALFPGDTAAALVALAVALYLALLAHRTVLACSALARRPGVEVGPAELDALDDRTLPVYTVLVPLRGEAAVVPRLVAALERLDYPRHKLDVRLLCEEDDEGTLAAIRELRLPAHFTLVVGPDAEPRTKPRALAFGLAQARGELVAVFDAEDRPDPDQLRKAASAFARLDGRVACLQARLGCFNAEQNLLTKWFAAEYALWFDLLLPALARRRRPLPLGGSSNHFVVARLVEVGGWDPFNVTEDADLGIRLHKAGYLSAVLDSTTLEEAVPDLGGWIRQRSRWTKGHVQTWLVHMRHPLRLARRLGPGGLLAFHLTVGAALVVLVSPLFWGLTTLLFLSGAGPLPAVFPTPVFHAAVLALVVGNVALAYLHVAAALERRAFALVKAALLVPLYWGLVSLAAWRGFLQLLTRPFLWEKTEHGRDDGRAP